MNPVATVFKLAEARFFFEKLSAADRRVMNPEPEAFAYYLSAFLSAACSIKDVLCTEQPRKLKKPFGVWFARWEASLCKSDQSLWNSVYRQRVATVHLRGVALKHRLEPMQHTDFAFAAAQEGFQVHVSAPPGTPRSTHFRAVRSLDLDGSDVDVTKACGRYLEIATGLMESYREHFGKPAAT
jgi:hypothetical protein